MITLYYRNHINLYGTRGEGWVYVEIEGVKYHIYLTNLGSSENYTDTNKPLSDERFYNIFDYAKIGNFNEPIKDPHVRKKLYIPESLKEELKHIISEASIKDKDIFKGLYTKILSGRFTIL
jgi:hypothetical protein